MRYEVILVRYVPELVYCEVDAMDETKAVKKAKRAAKLIDPSIVANSFDAQILTERTIRIDAKSIDVRELPPDTSRQ